jgi:hypothetical protein
MPLLLLLGLIQACGPVYRTDLPAEAPAVPAGKA